MLEQLSEMLIFYCCCGRRKKDNIDIDSRGLMPDIAAKFKELAALNPEAYEYNFPDSFICPISQDLMRFPVRVPSISEGKYTTCDKLHIEKWLDIKRTSPFDRGVITRGLLVPDYELAQIIYESLQAEIDNLHHQSPALQLT